VISGKKRGLKLATLDSDKTRPTTDRVKESLFNIIAPFVEDAKILDLFSGSGSLAIEAISRGAQSAVLVDKNPESIKIIQKNLEHSGFTGATKVLNLDYNDALKVLSNERTKFDIIFLDPPYSKSLIDSSLKLINNYELIIENGLIVAEKYIDDVVPENEGFMKLVRKQKYGTTELCFYRYFVENSI
jgi:RNA methyltransferase, RsmD family